MPKERFLLPRLCFSVHSISFPGTFKLLLVLEVNTAEAKQRESCGLTNFPWALGSAHILLLNVKKICCDFLLPGVTASAPDPHRTEPLSQAVLSPFQPSLTRPSPSSLPSSLSPQHCPQSRLRTCLWLTPPHTHTKHGRTFQILQPYLSSDYPLSQLPPPRASSCSASFPLRITLYIN